MCGIMARGMRKTTVALMVMERRPGANEYEWVSQGGTRLTCLLGNDRDVEAVLSGTPGSRQLRTVLSRVEAKPLALIFVHSLPMPVVVRSRDYGYPESYAQLSRAADPLPGLEAETPQERLEREISELF